MELISLETQAENVINQNAEETNTVAEVTDTSETKVPESQSGIQANEAKLLIGQMIRGGATKEQIKEDYMSSPNASEALFEQLYSEAQSMQQEVQENPTIVQSYSLRGR